MRATLIGAIAILCWSTLAALMSASGGVPPFQLAAMTFTIGSTVGIASWLVRGVRLNVLRQPPKVWLLGVSGLFGYHAFYFFALATAPPAEASLINYLWPLIMVVLSALLPGETLRLRHIVGALLGLAGTVILIAGRAQVTLDTRTLIGCAAALGAALVWSTYSIAMAALSRASSARGRPVPSDIVVGYCLVTAVLAALAHVLVEKTTVWPTTAMQWSCVVAMGIGPVGIAFYAWDHGVKHGDLKLLGTLSYATPVLSTLWLVLAGYADPTPAILVSCVLIILGAAIASPKSPKKSRAGRLSATTQDSTA